MCAENTKLLRPKIAACITIQELSVENLMINFEMYNGEFNINGFVRILAEGEAFAATKLKVTRHCPQLWAQCSCSCSAFLSETAPRLHRGCFERDAARKRRRGGRACIMPSSRARANGTPMVLAGSAAEQARCAHHPRA